MAIIRCKECGKEVSDTAGVCIHCGAPITKDVTKQPCKKCGSSDIDIQIFQENLGGGTITKTKSKYKQKGHGILWWLTIGWWWWIVDIFLWIYFFIPRLLIQIFKKKKYKGSSTSVSTTKNVIGYKTVFLCKNCGERWEK